MKKTLFVTVCLVLLSLLVPAFAQEASLSGCAYVDTNANLVCDSGEALLAGVPVKLEAATEEGWQTVQETVTDEYGHYTLSVPAGDGEYRVASSVNDESLFVAAVGQTRLVENNWALAYVNGSDMPMDISLREGVKLTVVVYNDENANGQQGTYEEGVPGILVELLDGEEIVASGVTYRKNPLSLTAEPGDYRLRATLTDDYAFTVKGSQSVMEGMNGTAESDVITLSAEGSNKEYIAVRSTGSFSGMAFEDVNNNGILDEGDEGVAGVTVYLSGERTGTKRELVTGEDGLYNFIRLPGDRYTVTAQLPEGMLYARYSQQGGDLRSIFTGENLERVFSVKAGAATESKHIGVIQRGAIAGRVFLDLNYNGIPDEGEPGYAGVTLQALKQSDGEAVAKTVSLEDGTFRVENLRSTTYRLRAVLPDDGSLFTVTAEGEIDEVNLFEQRSNRREYTVAPIVMTSGEERYAVVGVALGATISGTVFEDADYNGRLNGSEKKLSGIEVRAVDMNGEVAAEAVTAKNGTYTLKGLMPGSYIVQVQRKKDHGFTRLRPQENGGSFVTVLEGKYGVTDPIDVAMGEEITAVNAGMLPSSTVSGSFFHDANDNGAWDKGETGMMSAEVRLLSADGEIDLYQSPDEKGNYFFDGVMPGEYTLSYLLPEHTEMAKVTASGNTVAHQGLITTTAPFKVQMGKGVKMPQAGAVTLGSFIGGVFNDTNANGVCDSGEAMLGGAQLTAVSASGEEFTATAGADGAFALTDLRPDDYSLTIALPNGYIFTDSLSADELVLEAVSEQTFECPWQALINRTEKAIGAVVPAAIRGEIWMDENKNATQEDGEWIMEGLTLALIDEITEEQVAATVTDADGFCFDNVRPGVYTVQFDLPEQASPAGASASTFIFDGAVMAQTGLNVAEGEALYGLNTGLVSTTSIGGTAWLDENGQRTAVAGVTVTLWQNGAYAASTLTDENGVYRFDGLWPDTYAVSASIPSGLIFVRPGDPNYESGESIIASVEYGMSASSPLYMAQHRLQEDILYIKAAKVGDLVWLDENENGLLDGGEHFMPGVTVRLLQNGTVMYETVSDQYGYYIFDDVYPGEYMLEASAYEAVTPTEPNEALRIISSCLTGGDGLQATSDVFRVESGERNLNFDLGYVLLPGQRIPEEVLVDGEGRDWSTHNSFNYREVW